MSLIKRSKSVDVKFFYFKFDDEIFNQKETRNSWDSFFETEQQHNTREKKERCHLLITKKNFAAPADDDLNQQTII